MADNFMDILESIENSTLEVEGFECDNLPTTDMIIKEAKIGYRLFQDNTFIVQISDMYPKEYGNYIFDFDTSFINDITDVFCLEGNEDNNDNLDRVFIESVLNDFEKKYQCKEEYVISFSVENGDNLKEEVITFSNILNESIDNKLEYILDEDSIKNCLLEAGKFVKLDAEELPIDEYWDKYHEIYAATCDNLKHLKVSVSGDLEYTFTYDELLKTFNKICHDINIEATQLQAELMLEDEVTEYYKAYVLLYEKTVDLISNYKESEERFFKQWEEKNIKTLEKVEKLANELFDKYSIEK